METANIPSTIHSTSQRRGKSPLNRTWTRRLYWVWAAACLVFTVDLPVIAEATALLYAAGAVGWVTLYRNRVSEDWEIWRADIRQEREVKGRKRQGNKEEGLKSDQERRGEKHT